MGAVPELITHDRTGLIVETADPEAVAGAVHRLFLNPGLRNSISHSAHEAVIQRFSWDTLCSTLLRMYSGAPEVEAVLQEYSEPGRK